MDNDRLVGCITTQEVKQIPREEWALHTVGEKLSPCSEGNTISPEADAAEAVANMNRSGRSRLMVVTEDHLDGIISLKDLLAFLSLKMELEGENWKRRI